MLWEHARTGFLDELGKIAAVSLSGLSPETVLEKGVPPPPMPSAGYEKARNILERAETIKTASSLPPAHRIPYLRKATSIREDGPPPTSYDKAKRLLGHTAAGMGVGKLVTEIAAGPQGASNPTRWWGMVAGGGVGLLDYARKQYREKRHREKKLTKKATISSPGLALKARQQVGKIGNRIDVGKSTTSQISGRLIGRKFVP